MSKQSHSGTVKNKRSPKTDEVFEPKEIKTGEIVPQKPKLVRTDTSTIDPRFDAFARKTSSTVDALELI